MDESRPGPVKLREGNISANWAAFEQRFDIYWKADPSRQGADVNKWAVLMREAGREALEVYNSFRDSLITAAIDANGSVVKTDLSENYEAVIAEFRKYAEEKKSVTSIREAFFKRNQKPGEPFATWHTKLKNMIKDCEFLTIADSLLKDRLIGGTNDKRLKETLRGQPQLTLAQVESMSRSAETRRKEEAENSGTVDSVETKQNKKRPFSQVSRGGSSGTQSSFRGHRGAFRGRYVQPRRGQYHRGGYWGGWVEQSPAPYDCKKCATRHGPRRCPAYNKECHRCGDTGHFEKVCSRGRAKKPRVETVTKIVEVVRVVEPPPKPVESVVVPGVKELAVPSPKVETPTRSAYLLDSFSTDEEVAMNLLSDHMEVNMVDTITEDGELRKLREYTEAIRLQGKHFVNFKLDCGSQVNIVPYDLFCELNSKGDYTLTQSSLRLEAFNQTMSPVEGSFMALAETKHGAASELEFVVTKSIKRPLLGIEACYDLNLVKRVNHPKEVSLVMGGNSVSELKDTFIAENRDVFEGLGQFKQTIHLEVNKDSPAGMCPPRRYSVAIGDRLKVKLDSLASSETPSEQVNAAKDLWCV
ncbi:Gag polyprotein [Frankliniella fusca]|uniref:Gag polyprotein n=1 Tax=Frankliniella fusca TaxID=407009 RepID=A0AAE1LQ87_9NEOP|nr:Gag polyprotein [Frankliniella fusca]